MELNVFPVPNVPMAKAWSHSVDLVSPRTSQWSVWNVHLANRTRITMISPRVSRALSATLTKKRSALVLPRRMQFVESAMLGM